MPESSPQHLDRDRAPWAILLRRVDDAHAARSDRVEHEKVPEHRAGLQRAIDRRHVERRNPRRDRESHRPEPRWRRAAHRPRAQTRIVAAALAATARRDRRVRRPPAPGRSLPPGSRARSCRTVGLMAVPSGPSARNSHARANVHSFFTVAGERSSADAVSSMLRPAKYRKRDDLRFARIGRLETRQRFVDGDHVGQVGICAAIASSTSTCSPPAPCLMRR